MKCVVKCLKCCTDKVVAYANCLAAPPSIGLIVAKAYEVPKINDVSWGYIIAPTAIIVGVNIAYYSCCRFILNRHGTTSLSKETELNQV